MSTSTRLHSTLSQKTVVFILTAVFTHSPEQPKGNTKNLRQDSWPAGRDLNPVLLEYEAGVLTTQSPRFMEGVILQSCICAY
jgi:hypothetical protein